jgi:DNA-binding protein H-NS
LPQHQSFQPASVSALYFICFARQYLGESKLKTLGGVNRMQQLRTMSIDKLSKLKSQVESALASKVAETRRKLESELAKLSGGLVGTGHRGGARGKVAPKYRNPDNPSETWAGRGLKPKWLVAAMKGGKNLEHFAISASAKTAAVKKSRGRPRKK